jgi:hypothetical protein
LAAWMKTSANTLLSNKTSKFIWRPGRAARLGIRKMMCIISHQINLGLPVPHRNNRWRPKQLRVNNWGFLLA